MTYTPTPFPDGGQVSDYLVGELRQIAAALAQIEEGRGLPILHAEPAKPREGALILADGTDWNPGSGAGHYERRAGVWVKL